MISFGNLNRKTEEILIMPGNLSLEELWALFPITFADNSTEFAKQFLALKEPTIMLVPQ